MTTITEYHTEYYMHVVHVASLNFITLLINISYVEYSFCHYISISIQHVAFCTYQCITYF